MRQATPNLPAGVLLDRIAPGDRGAMLQMLLAGSAEQAETQTLWAVAGQNLLRIDFKNFAAAGGEHRAACDAGAAAECAGSCFLAAKRVLLVESAENWRLCRRPVLRERGRVRALIFP